MKEQSGDRGSWTARRLGFLSRDRIIAPPGYNRWRVAIASVAIHLCIGSLYAWSIFNPALTRVNGVATSAGGDWSLDDVVWIFTFAIICVGLCAAFAGRWLERVGPRLVGAVAACCWGGGYLIGAVGIFFHLLPLVYIGYGALGGCGIGLGYVSPVRTLLNWFPDRRGLATGLAIMGFGGGAIIAAPLKEFLIRLFYRMPDYLGSVADVDLVARGGKWFADVEGTLREVVVVGASDAQSMIVRGAEGVYVVGTGDVGVMWTFVTLGLFYFAVMAVAAMSYRIPAPGWKPEGWEPQEAKGGDGEPLATADTDVRQAVRTRQFYLLWIMLCLNVTAGIGVLGVATTMLTDIFGPGLPGIVDGGFAASYVVMISVFNMGGRIGWSSASDYLGRKRTYWIFFGLGVILYASIPFMAIGASIRPSVLWLVLFYAATMVIFSMFGGGFATIPAYLADVFGTKFIGSIHGRLLTAWSAAGVLGPVAITSLRRHSEVNAIRGLAEKVDAQAFVQRFGAGADQIDLLIREKTVTIARLMEIAPEGTRDPSVGLYNTTMFFMVALLVAGFIANAKMGPLGAVPPQSRDRIILTQLALRRLLRRVFPRPS